jgi:hypothetical protein
MAIFFLKIAHAFKHGGVRMCQIEANIAKIVKEREKKV